MRDGGVQFAATALFNLKRRRCSTSAAVVFRLVRHIQDKDKEAVAHLFFDFGTFSIAFSEGNDFEMSVNALQLSLELFKDVSVTKPQCKQYVDETEAVLLSIKKEIGNTSPQNMRTKLEENDPEKVAALYQFQYHYEKGDSAEREKSFEKAILNYKAALEQLDIIEKLGAPVTRLTLADIYDRIALCYEMLDVFLSYKSEDEILAKKVYDYLTQSGKEVFFAK